MAVKKPIVTYPEGYEEIRTGDTVYGAGGGGNACTCVVNFGTGKDVATVVVTGQTWVVAATTIIVCQASGEDARLEGIICNAHTLVDGVGFTVTAQALYIAVGTYTINCIGV